MANTSATGGYLSPNNQPDNDAILARTLHDFIAGVTGIVPKNIRPRWQPNPPVIPSSEVDWCGFGVTNTDYGLPYQSQKTCGEDTKQEQVRDEAFTVLLSFYGTNCVKNCNRISQGLTISQNREALYLAGISVIGVGGVIRSPELVNDVWLDRADVEIVFGRRVVMVYDVLHFLGAGGSLESETTPAESWSVED